MVKKAKVKGLFLVLVVIMCGLLSMGAVVRLNRKQENVVDGSKQETVEDGLLGIWETGRIDGMSGAEVEVRNFYYYRTAYIPFDEFNVLNFKTDQCQSMSLFFYDEEKSYLNECMNLLDGQMIGRDFEWDYRSQYTTIKGNRIPESTKYVRISLMGKTVGVDIDLDKIVITYNQK
jgi:hypothetical protein